jgi:hypothetical protein
MHLTELKQNENAAKSAKSNLYQTQIEYILNDLKDRDLPDYVIKSINADVEEINSTDKADYALHKLLKQKQKEIVTLLEKEMKIVTINHYRNLWMVVGMSAFGLPIGFVFGMAIGSISFIGIGLPIGMTIGMAVGTNMDKKALADGRQLSIEIKY